MENDTNTLENACAQNFSEQRQVPSRPNDPSRYNGNIEWKINFSIT